MNEELIKAIEGNLISIMDSVDRYHEDIDVLIKNHQKEYTKALLELLEATKNLK